MAMLLPYKCDFQVHSPRDWRYKSWPASKMTLEGLAEWVDLLLTEAGVRGLDCIAVTDHHDLWAGVVAHCVSIDHSSGVQVIPGLEVTSRERLQAILLLDPSVFWDAPDTVSPESSFAQQAALLTLLGQTVTAPQQPDTSLSPVQYAKLVSLADMSEDERPAHFQLPVTERVNRSLEEIGRALEESYRDKYVLLPNAEKNKHGVLLNDVGKSLYLQPPLWFVGGIRSGAAEIDETIFSGKNSDFGKHQIAVLATSDQRGHDESEQFAEYFGDDKNSTWVYLSDFTSVSLTQALISGTDRRVFHDEPKRPREFLEQLTVAGCGLLASSLETFDFSSDV